MTNALRMTIVLVALLGVGSTSRAMSQDARNDAKLAGSKLVDAKPVDAKPVPPNRVDTQLVDLIRRAAHPLTGHSSDYDALVRRIGSARIVLLGEDTHGTREFYIERARITRRLIEQHGFVGVVIEGDWTEAMPLRTAVTTSMNTSEVDDALRAFERFPRWMWSNSDFRDLALWLQRRNAQRLPGTAPVAIHGMDVYDVQGSAIAVLEYLRRVDADAAVRAGESYACLETRRIENGIAVDKSPRWPDVDCAEAVQAPLTALITGAATASAIAGGVGIGVDPDAFDALQNARIVVNGEAYHRAMHRGSDESWDLRDMHMASTIDLLLSHLDTVIGQRSRLVVWAHNAHVGDIRATSRGDAGRLSIGQLLRERYADDAVIVGLMTATGTVRAAIDWGGPDRAMQLSRPLPGSHGRLLQRSRLPRFYIVTREMQPALAALDRPRPQRGIGVRYVKAYERLGGHYYAARLGGQYDALVFIERTRALRNVANRKRAVVGKSSGL